MSKRTHELVATVGSYTAANGESKKRYQKCGSVFTYPDGGMSVKLDCVPVGQEWSGWLSAYPAGEQGAQPAAAKAQGLDDMPY